jgi:hypothetical protein
MIFYDAQRGRKYLSAKNLDPKYLRVNSLRMRICAGWGKWPSAPVQNELPDLGRDVVP